MSAARRWTMADIRDASTGHFFDRKAMRGFGDTMRSFAVVDGGKPGPDGLVTFRRVRPMTDSRGVNMGGVGKLSNIDEAAEAGEITDAGVADAVHWLEGWVCAQSARLGVEIVT
jgi:hypothetical protein